MNDSEYHTQMPHTQQRPSTLVVNMLNVGPSSDPTKVGVSPLKLQHQLNQPIGPDLDLRSTQIFDRMNFQLGAGKLVESVLQALPPDENEAEEFWVKDCLNNPALVENLSYSKMLYE